MGSSWKVTATVQVKMAELPIRVVVVEMVKNDKIWNVL